MLLSIAAVLLDPGGVRMATTSTKHHQSTVTEGVERIAIHRTTVTEIGVKRIAFPDLLLLLLLLLDQ